MLANNNHVGISSSQPATASSSQQQPPLQDERMRREKDVAEFASQIVYSKRYSDDLHVILPKQLAKHVTSTTHLLTEPEWRALGVTQSPGWQHYMIHAPEPHILLFKRSKELGEKYPPAQ